MTVLNAPATCQALPPARLRVRCCRRLIPTPARREDQDSRLGPCGAAVPAGEALLQSLRDRQGSDRALRPGACRERSRLLRAWGEQHRRSASVGLSQEVHLRRGSVVDRHQAEGERDAVTLRLGSQAGTWAASAQGPCAGPSLTQEEKKCDRLSHRCHFPTRGHL